MGYIRIRIILAKIKGVAMNVRQKFIGSSDIAGVLGLSRWTTPLKIWAEKTGEIEPDDLSKNEYVEWGSRLEGVVAKKFADKNNCKLIAYKKRYMHKNFPYMTCELDRLIAGTDELVEIKTANAWKFKEWSEGDEMPLEYILQVMFALGLSGRKVGHVAVLIGGNKYIEKRIEFDKAMFDDMVDKARDFWENYVLENVPPVAIAADNDNMVNLYPNNINPDLIEVNEEFESWVKMRQELSMHLGEMIDQKKDVEAKMKAFIGEFTGVETESYKVTWKKQLKKEYVVPASETRVLRVSKKKQEAK